MTRSMCWAMDTMIDLCESEEQRQAMRAMKEMLLAFEKDTVKLAFMDEEQRMVWLNQFVHKSKIVRE